MSLTLSWWVVFRSTNSSSWTLKVDWTCGSVLSLTVNCTSAMYSSVGGCIGSQPDGYLWFATSKCGSSKWEMHHCITAVKLPLEKKKKYRHEKKNCSAFYWKVEHWHEIFLISSWLFPWSHPVLCPTSRPLPLHPNLLCGLPLDLQLPATDTSTVSPLSISVWPLWHERKHIEIMLMDLSIFDFFKLWLSLILKPSPEGHSSEPNKPWFWFGRWITVCSGQ